MRLLARFVAVAGLVVAGGLTLPGGVAQAAACSGTSGVTVVIDYGSTTSTSCVSGDPATAMAALKAVAAVVSPQRYPGTVVCRINGTPASDPCVQMPPASAYWAFYHAPRGGSWTYSSAGVTSYNPAPGTAIGFAFGAGARPGVNPPAAAPAPSPKPKPSPSSSSSKPPAAKPKPVGTTPVKPGGSSTSGSAPAAGTRPAPSSSASATPGSKPSTTTGLPYGSTSTKATPPGSVTVSPNGSTGSGETTAAAADDPDSGTPMTLLAGLGLVGLVGAGAAYLAMRRRTTT